MIVMDIQANNILCFNDFAINFSYPKKIINSSIDKEWLEERPNFRYKKVNILMGGNATGKSSLGKILMVFVNYFKDGSYGPLVSLICDRTKNANLQIDFVTNGHNLYRFTFVAEASVTKQYNASNVHISIESTKINKKDSYEICKEKLDTNTSCKKETFEALKLGECSFSFPKTNALYAFITQNSKYITVLEKVLRTLDPAIQSVKPLQDVENAFVIKLDNIDVVLQDGKIVNDSILSSGTREGIDISYVLASAICQMHDLYYCDEIFSYVNSDLEKACLSILIEKIVGNRQMFFTTHNSDVLEMDLPKHAYTFLKKEICDDKIVIKSVYAADYLKKANESLKNAVENDLFCVAPELNEIYDITEL